MNFKKSIGLLLLALTFAGGACAQNPAVTRLTQFAETAPQEANATAIGVLCFPGNRLTARLQDDCNNLVGNAFVANPDTDTAVRTALRSITADNATIPIDRSGLGKLNRLPNAPSATGPGWAALLSADESMVALNIAGDDSAGSDWSMYINARFNNDSRDASSNEDSFDSDGNAVTVGFDLRTSAATHVGAAVVYGTSNLDFGDNSGSLDATDVGFELYAGWQGASGLYLDSLLSFNSRDHEQVRRINYGLGANTVNQAFDAQFDAEERLLALTAGYQFSSGAASFDPYARIEFVDAQSDGYAERSRAPTSAGGGWALLVDEMEETFTRGVIGLRAAYAISASNGVYVPFFDLSWIGVSGVDANAARVRYAGDLSANVNAAPVDFFMVADDEDDSYGSAALGLSAQWANGWSGFLSYRANFSEDLYDRDEVNLGLRMEF